jgi:uncharacterized protein
MLIGLDSNCVIYFVENHPIWGLKVATWLAVARAAGHQFAVSELARAECLVGPYRKGDQRAEADFENFFKSPYVTRHPIVTAVCEQAARLRAQFNFKLPDALNLAAAMVHGCGRYLTNDARLTRCTSITVEVLA